MLKNDKKTAKMVDERQQLQSLTNAKNCFTIIVMLLGVSIIIQTIVFAMEPMHYLPELFIMLFCCVLNIVLEVKQGNLYTKEMQSRKKNLILYFVCALVTALLLCGGNFIKYDFPPHFLFLIVPITFAFLFGTMLLMDWLFKKSAEKKLEKIEDRQFTPDNEEE